MRRRRGAKDLSPTSCPSRPRAGPAAAMLGVLVAVSALALGAASSAAADEVELPPAPGAATAPGAAPAPAAPAAAPATPAPVARTVAVRLRIGSQGSAVRDLQRELRRRGIPVTVDGEFGPATKKAVKRMQKRLGMAPTGIADTPLLKRLGLQTRAAAERPRRGAGDPDDLAVLEGVPGGGQVPVHR